MFFHAYLNPTTKISLKNSLLTLESEFYFIYSNGPLYKNMKKLRPPSIRFKKSTTENDYALFFAIPDQLQNI